MNLDEIWNQQDQELDLHGKCALITGASSGIGLATAFALAKRGVHLVLNARRKDKLVEIQDFLKFRTPNVIVTLIVGDVTAKNVQTQIQNLSNLDILINNAGLALGTAHFFQTPDADIQQMIDVNVTALMKVTKAILPGMVAKKTGHIVNVASIAGHAVYPGGAVYCPSKYAVVAFSQALRQELYEHNVRVSMVSPGMVQTEFSVVRFFGDVAAANKVYEGMRPLSSVDIAHQIVYALTRPQHVNVDEIVSMPTAQGGIGKVFRSPQ